MDEDYGVTQELAISAYVVIFSLFARLTSSYNECGWYHEKSVFTREMVIDSNLSIKNS